MTHPNDDSKSEQEKQDELVQYIVRDCLNRQRESGSASSLFLTGDGKDAARKHNDLDQLGKLDCT